MAEPTAHPCRVLIANQAREVCLQLTDLLGQEGYETIEVHNGPEALWAIRRRLVDVAVLDLLLPGLNALELLREARKVPGGLPVIVTGLLSARPTSGVVRQLGAAGYLTLPAGRDELAAVVRRALHGSPPRPGDAPPTGGEVPRAEPVGAALLARLTSALARALHQRATVQAGLCNLLLEAIRFDHPAWAVVEELRRKVERASGLAHGLLAFTHGCGPGPERLSAGAVVHRMLPVLRELVPEDVELATALGPAREPVLANPHLVEQLVLHLVLDALEAMPRGGQLTIETRKLASGRAAAPRPVAAGACVMLAVADTGLGNGPATPAIDMLVKELGGDFEVTGRPGQGTARVVYLPAAEEVAAAAPGGGRRAILLVEDDARVRSVVREILVMGGYAVLEAESGTGALCACAGHTGPIDLLVADVLVPGLNGQQLFRQLAPRYPGLKVLYLSGLPAGVLAERGWLRADEPLLEKPFTPAALLAKVGAILSGPPTLAG